MQPLRLAELLAGMSLVADVGMGLEPGEAARAALVAMELASLADAADPSDVYYTTLMQHVGCTAYAHEAARMLGGDELAVKRAAVHTDFARPSDVVRTYLPNLAPSARLATRVAAAGTVVVRARQIVHGYSRANCEVAARTADRVGLGPGVVAGLLDVYEQWNGKGGPHGLRGAAIAHPARIAQVAATAALFHGVGGRAAAVEAIRQRAGQALDPELVELLERRGGDPVGVLDSVEDPVAAAVGAEPGLPSRSARHRRWTGSAVRSARSSTSRRRCTTATARASPRSRRRPRSAAVSRRTSCTGPRSCTTSGGRRYPTASGSAQAR
jgi:hypothetical protein